MASLMAWARACSGTPPPQGGSTAGERRDTRELTEIKECGNKGNQQTNNNKNCEANQLKMDVGLGEQGGSEEVTW